MAIVDQLKRLLQSLSTRQRILIGMAAVLVAGGLWWLAHWNKERDFKPLYTGLSGEDAGAIVTKLKESGTEYRIVDNGGAVQVPSAKVNELRLALASAGLPKSGRIGYELFDKMNFGQTDFAEQVNYRRALEGELERTIMSMAEIEQARVHLSFAKDSLFTESKQSAKASVLAKVKEGKKLSSPNVEAMKNLIASAVEGLQPEMVSVVDSKGQTLGVDTKLSLEEGATDRMLEFRKKVEQNLLEKVKSTLEPILGPQRFRAGVTVDCDLTSGDQSEETFDPNKSVMVNSQRSEDSGTTATTGGIPGVQPNLPRPPARALNGGGTVNRRTENISFQTSRVVRHMKLPEGTLKRVSVSVLLDQRSHWDVVAGKAKLVMDPPTPAEMKSLKDVVSAVVGIDTARGDLVVVETLPFDATRAAQPPPGLIPAPPAPALPPGAKPADPGEPLWKQQKLQIIAGAVVGGLVVLGALFMLWKKKRNKKKGANVKVEHGAEAIEGKNSATDAGSPKQLPDSTPAQTPQELEKKAAEEAQLAAQQEKEVLAGIKLPETTTKKGEVLKKHIRDEIKKSPEAIANVVRTWLNSVHE